MTGEWAGPLDRRQALAALGALGLAAVATACSGGSSQPSASNGSTAPAGGSPATTASGASCVLAPETTAGPYYLDNQKLRSDITDGRPGTPLALAITVVDAERCDAISNAAVDIWHADAGGDYSGFGGASTGGPGPGGGGPTDQHTFLRGVQMTDDAGLAKFTTIWPGWYRGRAVHIHVEARVDDQLVHTGQFFFSDELNNKVLNTGAYKARSSPDTINDSDSIFRDAGGAAAILDAQPAGDGYRAAVTVGVRNE